MKKILFLTLIGFLCTNYVTAQFTVNAELRTRGEYRHGYKILFTDNMDPAFFVAQRTRLNTQYQNDKLKIFLSLQDVRTWGDVAQLNVADKNGLAIHQAYAELKLSSAMALKLGRQEIVYDDARFMGNVDWTTQGRSHDALLFKYAANGSKFELGVAYNQENEALNENLYLLSSYKTFQYAWYHKDFEKLGLSFLFFNDGQQFIDALNADNNETRFSQTLGSHFDYKQDKLSLSGNAYYQFGKDKSDNSLSAYLLALDLGFKTSDKVKLGLGAELISGNEYGMISDSENHAFTPLYGTNHKFNGHMDYFYVGNHANSVGLVDLHAMGVFSFTPNNSLNATLHHFSAAQDIIPGESRALGMELDLAYNYKFADYGTFTLGYSQMFAQDGLKILRGNTQDNVNNWVFAMLTLKPTFFTNK